MYLNRTFLLIAVLSATVMLSGCLGVEGGADVLSEKFQGVDAVEVISPTSVIVRWTPKDNMVKYKIFASSQSTPIGTSLFSSYVVPNLTPGTNYSFSVSGVKASGSEEGIAQSLSAKTWPQFAGPTAATAVDFSNVKVSWDYFAGPTFMVYYNADTPPDEDQLKGEPDFLTQSNSGMTISGLSSNTTYYFSIVAKYPDKTTSLAQYTFGTSTVSASVTGTSLSNDDDTMLTFPSITTAAKIQTSDFATFTVSGSISSYITTIYNGDILPANAIGTVTGNGTITSSQTLAAGTYNLKIKVHDTMSGVDIFEVIGPITVSANIAAVIPTVSALTPTSLTDLPTVTGPFMQIGPYPSFTITGSASSYNTQIWYGTTMLGSMYGDGVITTARNLPLPRGKVTVKPKVVSDEDYAWLPELTFVVRDIDPMPYTGPTNLNDGGAGSGMGSSIAVGDFNCDGYPDVALGGPNASFAVPANYHNDQQDVNVSNGVVVVYYGQQGDGSGNDNFVGIDVPPSTHPVGLNPLLIAAPNNSGNVSFQGIHFGSAMVAGNINKDKVANISCDDLVVSAPQDYSELWGYSYAGAIYTFYGSPNGLQVTPYVTNNVTCLAPGNYVCGTGKYEVVNENMVYNTTGWGLGTSLAIGDFNGDGYLDVAAGYPSRSLDWIWKINEQYNDGAVYLFYGTPNGLSPNYTRILMPLGTTVNSGTMFGASLAFTALTDSYTNNPRKKDLLIGAPGLNNGNGNGFMWVKGTNDLPSFIGVDANPDKERLVSGYQWYQPDICTPGTQCGYRIISADLNNDKYDDVIFSAPTMNKGWTNNGAVMIMYGYSGGYVNWSGPSTDFTDNLTTCLPSPAVAPAGCTPERFYRTDGYTNWMFGSSLAVLGDLNGDGLPEIGIGAQGANPAKNGKDTRNGVAYIYNASTQGLLPTPSSAINLSVNKYSLFGGAMAGGNFFKRTYTAPDSCANKSCNDVIVTSPGEGPTAGSYGHGITRLFSNTGNGFPIGVNSASKTFPLVSGKIVIEGFEAASIVGDINHDGYADVAVTVVMTGPLGGPSVWGATTSGVRRGFVVYYGSSSGLITTPDPSFTPLKQTDPLVVCDMFYDTPVLADPDMADWVMPMGDVNGDGFADVGALGTGHLYLFYGSAAGLIVYPWPKVTPVLANDPKIYVSNLYGRWWWGSALGRFTVGDWNGDGYSDLAVTNGDNGYWDYVNLLAYVSGPMFIFYGSKDGPANAGSINYYENPSGNPLNDAVLYPDCSGVYPNQICRPVQICPYLGGDGTMCRWEPSDAQLALGPPGTASNISDVWSRQIDRVQNLGDVDGDGTDDLGLTYSLDSSFQSYNGSVIILYGSKQGDGVDGPGISPRRMAHLMLQPEYGSGRRLGSIDAYGGFAKAGDINGDGIADFVVSSARETSGPNGKQYSSGGAVYLIYGINGGYQGTPFCAAYPCYNIPITNSPGNIATHQPMQIVDDINGSCDSATGSCNVLRFYPAVTPFSGYGFGGGVLGLGDITGDKYGEIAVSTAFLNPGRIFIFSGSATGLIVNAAPAKEAFCGTDKTCSPYYFSPPSSTALSYIGFPNMNYAVYHWSGAGDIDGDGKKDFLIPSPYFHDPNGKGYWIGGFWLFH